jgi:hypothetical protein
MEVERDSGKQYGNLEICMKNAIFWDVTPCGSCKNQYFGGLHCLHYQGDRNLAH